MPEHLLALDAGTTSIRALVVGLDGNVRARARETLPISYPAPGRVEQDPEHIWRAAQLLLHFVLHDANLCASDIIALGVTSQRASCMIWERATGRAVTPLVSWQDLRGADRAATLRDAGFFVLPQSAAAKLEAVLNGIPNGRARAAAGEIIWGNIDSYLLHRLSGGAIHATDPSQACTTAYFDFVAGDWAASLIEYEHLSPSFFPKLVDTSCHIGETARGLLPTRIPIAAVVGDQQSATVAQRCQRPGDGKVTYGTSATANVHSGNSVVAIQGTYPLVLARRSGQTEYCVEGMVITAGAVLDWLASILKPCATASDLDALAASVSDAAGAFMLPALQGLGSPQGDVARRGLVGGLSRSTTAAHIAYAALEGIAYRTRQVLDAVYAEGMMPRPTALRVDGGAAASDTLMQLQADLLGMPIERMAPLDASAFGAALLAAEGIGIRDRSASGQLRRVERIFEARISADEREARYSAWGDACQRSLC